MKKIILSLSALLIFSQHGLAGEKEVIEQANSYKHQKALYHVLLCEIEMKYHSKDGDASVCINAAKSIIKGENLGVLSKDKQNFIVESYLNAGLIYDETGDDLNGYKYYMKAANLGGSNGIQAQNNLNLMCKENPWACK